MHGLQSRCSCLTVNDKVYVGTVRVISHTQVTMNCRVTRKNKASVINVTGDFLALK